MEETTNLYSILIPSISALLGVLIGGFITFWGNWINNKTQKQRQVLQYQKERLERLKNEAKEILSCCFEINGSNGAQQIMGVSKEVHKSVFDKNIKLINRVQILILVHFPSLSDQVQQFIACYAKSEIAERKDERAIAGIVDLDTEKWKLIRAIQEEIKKEEMELLKIEK